MVARVIRRAIWLMSLFAVTTANAQVSVSIPAVVVDRSGQPVHGLQKSDFEVRGGKSLSLDSVEEVPPLNFTGFAEPVPVFILYDAVDMPVLDRARVSQMLLGYLRKAADDHLAVTVLAYTAQGIVVIHDMSTDSKVFGAAMDRVLPASAQLKAPSTPIPPDDFSNAVDDEARQIGQLTKPMGIIRPSGSESLPGQQLESLRVVGQMLQHSRKRKLLVWMSSKFPFYVKDGDLVWNYTYSGDSGYYKQGENRIAALNSAYQVAIDSLNSAHMSVFPAPGATEDHGDAENTKTGLEELARRTGGDLLPSARSAEDLASTVADLCRHFDSYYILTLKMQPAHKSTWIDNTVKVNKPDTKITAAKGFFSIPQ
jgi:VWFA-related protein